MKIEKPYTNKQYADLAVYCNRHNCHIEDKGDYLTSVENEPYIPTAEEIKAQTIVELKANLAATDYAIIKIAEGVATAEDYADVIAQRRQWRTEINELEG